MSETWRIEGLKIIGPTGEICTMTWDQARGGIGAHEIVPKQKLIAAAPKLLALVKKLADAGLPFGDEPHDIDDSDVLDARAIVEAVEGV